MFKHVQERLVGAGRDRQLHRRAGDHGGNAPAGSGDRDAKRKQSTATKEGVDQPRQRQRGSEGAHHGGAGRQIEGK